MDSRQVQVKLACEKGRRLGRFIIQGGGPAAMIEGPFPEPIWRDNTIWETPAGLMPEEGFTKKKPAIKAPKPLTVEGWRAFAGRR